MKMHGWGRYPEVDAEVFTPQTKREVQELLGRLQGQGVTPRGLGRSYGDSSLGDRMLSTRWMNHLLSFDPESGVLYAEAAVSLQEILQTFVPKGWFLPVTPGTQFVTVGGAIASDVHGKNHHVAGCFCDHVEYLDLITGPDTILRCSPVENPELFHATCGGMGLTGIVYAAAIRLKPVTSAYIDQTTHKASNLREILELFAVHEAEPYSVAWIDCISTGSSLGRSLLMTGDHTRQEKLTVKAGSGLSLPVDMPSALLNRHTIRAFNTLYYHRIRERVVRSHTHYGPFFYPLDSIGDWNRMYGGNGFTQYQFVVPKAAGYPAMKAILETIAGSGKGSFLAVLKAFGKQNRNLLSFPMEGYTLALDFKIEPELFPLLDRLDSMVLDYGGRIYLTKDARMSEATFRRCYPVWEQFQAIREANGLKGRFTSLQSKRTGLD
ncbi:MAG: FAD-binding oxidoreductase [Chlorobiaceae bacterium]|nr:FAD-binding oxidoreductase [Chlorobiaceae bacterium]